ncbi:biotin carboxylase N-terminal domain-containing protein, partial [Pseudomonas aeruginosa]
MNPDYRSIQRILVAHRGEIACRVMRSARAPGIGRVAVDRLSILHIYE